MASAVALSSYAGKSLFQLFSRKTPTPPPQE
jgi:hypothetical protein